jgi:hypothetical protein
VLFVTASMLMMAQRDLSCWNHMLAVSLLLYPCFCRNDGMFLLGKAPFYVTLVCSYVFKMALLMEKKAKRTRMSQQFIHFSS